MKPLVAHFIGGTGDPSTSRIAGNLPVELRYPSFKGGLALIRTERVYKRVGPVTERDDQFEATYRFVREVIVHGG